MSVLCVCTHERIDHGFYAWPGSNRCTKCQECQGYVADTILAPADTVQPKLDLSPMSGGWMPMTLTGAEVMRPDATSESTMITFTTTAVQKLNGVSHLPETCVQRCCRVTGDTDAEGWRQMLHFCHVPSDGVAQEWEDAITRVLMSFGRLSA